jgi:hypothetical protein
VQKDPKRRPKHPLAILGLRVSQAVSERVPVGFSWAVPRGVPWAVRCPGVVPSGVPRDVPGGIPGAYHGMSPWPPRVPPGVAGKWAMTNGEWQIVNGDPKRADAALPYQPFPENWKHRNWNGWRYLGGQPGGIAGDTWPLGYPTPGEAPWGIPRIPTGARVRGVRPLS